MTAQRSPAVRTSLAFLAVAALCLLLADLEVTTLSPWGELGRMVRGLITPDFSEPLRLGEALLQTLAFGLVGVALAVAMGFPLALAFHLAPVRWYCAFVRAIHELFWALLFLQMVGLNPMCGVLAIALPYSGVLAKVYSEILEEADPRPLRGLPPRTGRIAAFFFVRLPDVWVHLKNYTAYRLECGLRSSAILGFVGFPTLGFYLDTAFREGLYSEVSALLILFYLLIASLKYWMRPRLTWAYVVVAWALLPVGTSVQWSNIVRFFTRDIVPAPIRGAVAGDAGGWAEGLPRLWAWGGELITTQALPGIGVTLLLSQIALVATGAIALGLFPLVSRTFVPPWSRVPNRWGLVVMRSTPEYILAFVFLLLWGPSWLPAIAALAIHNGAVIAHLIGRHVDEMQLRPDAPRGLNRYFYETLPRLYGQFLAFLFYRWEVILRESAILGILGIHTLGFYIDSALADDRQDRALLLILLTAALNLAVDALSRRLRARLRLKLTPEME